MAYNKIYYQAHRDRYMQYNKKYRKKHPVTSVKWKEYNGKRDYSQYRMSQKSSCAATKKKVFDHYGNKCACCNEKIPAFLTVDHVNNDGYKHLTKNGKRRLSGIKLYSWIIKHNYPDTIQILCMNCNFGKDQNNGICPHKEL